MRHATLWITTSLLGALLAWPAAALAQGSVEVALRAAMETETVEGDLNAAIEQYQRIIADNGNHRAIAAKAMLRLGGCYEKLGQEEARQTYQQLVDEYSDQVEEVEAAYKRLEGLTKVAVGEKPNFRRIQISGGADNGVLSPDGSKLAFLVGGSLWIVPVHGNVSPDIAGEPTRIADIPEGWDVGNLLSWSTNGEWIAVNGEFNGEETVYVIPTSGGEPRLVPMPPRGGHSFSYRLSLSPDGERLAFSARELGFHEAETNNLNRYIYTVPTRGGSPQRLTSTWSRLPAFSPDGKYIAYVGYREREDFTENNERSRYHGDLYIVPSEGGIPIRLATADGRLRGPVWSPDGRYIAIHNEPGRNNISQEIWVVPLSPDFSRDVDPRKITLPLVSGQMLAGWTPQGELGLFMETKQYGAVYTVPGSGGQAMQVSPQSGVSYPRWSRDGESIYHRLVVPPPADGPTVRLVHVPSVGGAVSEVTIHSERPLVSMVPGGGFDISPDGHKIVVTAGQVPYKQEEGVDMWVIPLSGGSPMRLTHDPEPEISPCWSPDGQWIAFKKHSPEDNSVAVYIIPSKGDEVRQVTSQGDGVDVGAIAFSPDGKRIAFFSDGAIKTKPVQGGLPEVLVTEVKHGRHSELAFSPNGDRIAFTTGRPYDGEAKIWIAQLGTGLSTELQTGLPEAAMYDGFSWSPDGEKIAFVAYMGGEQEFWLISDFLSD